MRAVLPPFLSFGPPASREPLHVVRRRPGEARRRLQTNARVVTRAVTRAARRRAQLVFARLSRATDAATRRAERRLLLTWGSASVALHLVALVPALRPAAPHEPPTVEQLRFIAPLLPREVPQPREGSVGASARLRWSGEGDAAPGAVRRDALGTLAAGRRAGGGAATTPGETVAASDELPVPAADTAQVFTAVDVDREIERAPDAAGPVYPEPLRQQGLEGQVVTEFVVDETGHVDLASVRVVEATHPLFSEAVRASLEGTRFSPALRGGMAVRQRALQAFAFKLARLPADSAGRALDGAGTVATDGGGPRAGGPRTGGPPMQGPEVGRPSPPPPR